MLKYEMPSVDVTEFCLEDVLSASSSLGDWIGPDGPEPPLDPGDGDAPVVDGPGDLFGP